MRYACVAALMLSLLSGVANAQQRDFSKVEIKSEVLAPGVAVLFGSGGNIGVSWGDDGTVLIDDQFAPLTARIQEAVAALGAKPVRFLINTHWHGDHTGGNENLGNAGALIMAHDNVRVRMVTGSTTAAPAAKSALPVVTYERGLKLHLNGDEVSTIALGHAGHTDGDSIVFWKKANVIHMGDLFMHKVSFPFVDLNSGGDVRGYIVAANQVLAMSNAQTKIIPGHGPMATPADLTAWRDMIATVIASVQAGIKAKKTMAQIVASKPAARWDNNPNAFITGDRFVEAVYKSLTAGRKTHRH